MTLGENIARLRAERRLSQGDLAAFTGGAGLLMALYRGRSAN